MSLSTGAESSRLYDKQKVAPVDEVKYENVMLWDPSLKEWCKLNMSISGIVLRCSSGISEWSLALDSYCVVERVRNPFELFSFADSSSSSEEEDLPDSHSDDINSTPQTSSGPPRVDEKGR